MPYSGGHSVCIIVIYEKCMTLQLKQVSVRCSFNLSAPVHSFSSLSSDAPLAFITSLIRWIKLRAL